MIENVPPLKRSQTWDCYVSRSVLNLLRYQGSMICRGKLLITKIIVIKKYKYIYEMHVISVSQRICKCNINL